VAVAVLVKVVVENGCPSVYEMIMIQSTAPEPRSKYFYMDNTLYTLSPPMPFPSFTCIKHQVSIPKRQICKHPTRVVRRSSKLQDNALCGIGINSHKTHLPLIHTHDSTSPSFQPPPTFLPPSSLLTLHPNPTSLSQTNCQITHTQLSCLGKST